MLTDSHREKQTGQVFLKATGSKSSTCRRMGSGALGLANAKDVDG